MHLQSLDLFGFKSFADKTVFNFHEGVTAIVGPNGCGKSNVLDAVRWVLGEQSAKALRGSEMADVIFNGAETRKPLGFAEVSLTFTNCGQELGVDWHDVRVTRRIYRDGNSEYLLNKTVCRLKDIHGLFADTGIGRTAYSMMEQGKIDLILSSRPEDRRAVFEEAAGITKYRTQKREALRKLEATEANLLRIGDIIKEVKRQIGSLQRQAGKARRYQALMADLQVLDTHHSRRQLDQFEAAWKNSASESARLNQSEQTTQAEIESGENQLDQERQELDEIDARIAEARAEVQRLQNEIATHRNRIEFNQQRDQEFQELIERYGSDIAATEAKRAQQQTQLQEINTRIAQTGQLLEQKEAELKELTERSVSLRLERSAREEELQSLQISTSKLQSRVATLEEELNGNSVRRETTAARISDLDAAISGATEQRDKARARLAEAREATRHQQETLESLLVVVREMEKQLSDAEQAVVHAEKNFASSEREITDKQSRLEILYQLNEEGEGLTDGSQAILRGLDDPERIRPALAGALASALDVDGEYVAALEAVLGRNIHAVVLQDSKLAAEIIGALTNKKLGQAALAISEFAAGAPTESAPSELPKGALAWAIDKVTTTDVLRPLVRRLLDRVIIARDVNHAIELKKQAPHLGVATLTGEFISVDGILFGGNTGVESGSLLERKARMNTLVKEKAASEERHEKLVRACAESKNQLKSAKERLEEARERHQTARLSHSTASGKVLLVEHELEEAQQKLAGLQSERTTLDQQVRAADGRIDALKNELTRYRQQLATEESRLAGLDQERETARAQEEDATERLNELRLAVATERQQHDHLLAQREPMAARETELSDLITGRQADIERYRNRLAVQANESSASETAIQARTVEAAAAEIKVTAIASERTTRLASISRLEAKVRQVRNSLNDLRDLRSKEEVRQTQLQLQMNNLAEHISRRYQVDLRKFEPDSESFAKTLRIQLKRRAKPAESTSPEPEERVRRLEPEEPVSPLSEAETTELEPLIAELTRQLDNMGPVNLDAVHEYDELEERFRFLETQNNDLTASRRELLDVIARINKTSQKLFAETFAQVRLNFREMFGELFAGGRADLILLDENDLLNSGIEITAKPPGKQLQSISLLSGGERTLTAVALLFAIYMVRPSPFCILDEMDAALDESSINRFIRVLERFVSQSQFIIITHNKRTIAKADILYGVTMEERGVSKLVGMKLTDPRIAKNNAKQPPAGTKATQSHFVLEGTERPHGFVATR